MGDLPEFFPAIPMVGSCHAEHRRNAHFQLLQSDFGTDEHQGLRKSPYGKRKSAAKRNRATIPGPSRTEEGIIPWRKDCCNPTKAILKQIHFIDKKSYDVGYN